MIFYKYHGAGNDFLVADGRDNYIDLTAERIAALCDRHTGIGADGVMVLERSGSCDFRMRYYNSDGSGGMMCGNGGRCIVAFAADLGYTHFSFEAPDGPHIAELVSGGEAGFSKEPRVIRLKMKDVSGAVPYPSADGRLDWFLDTGTRHLVRLVDDVASYDVVGEGRKLRNDSRFAPIGTNVDFVQVNADSILQPGCRADGQPCASHSLRTASIVVRTFEKGVEDETLACGTGIVASSLATWLNAYLKFPSFSGSVPSGAPVCVNVRARISDLSVTFTPEPGPDAASFHAKDIWLEGPAAYIARVEVV